MSRFHSLSLAAAVVLPIAALGAQKYDSKILIRGLSKPTGIAVHSSGDLYFTELPDPGKFSQRNTVSMYDAGTKRVTAIVRGEPGPTNIAVAADRTFYWTCNTVGPIMRGKGTSHATIARGNRPSGMAVSAAGRLYITQVPEPGKAMGRNNLAEIVGGTIRVLKGGEPEPVDVAVDASENLYWTCKTAGVILRRDAKSGAVSFVLEGLEKPTGIAIDAMGSLYFTEVPTPGKFGNQGGRNKVWKYDPNGRRLTLIKFGDPEPTDVAVSADGSRVYWTCTTAGVVMRADRTGAAPVIKSNSTTRIGDRVDMMLRASGSAGRLYLAGTSAGRGPIAVDSRFLPLSPDGIFFLSFGASNGVFNGFSGRLDNSGNATSSIQLPNLAGLRGLALHTAFIVLDASSASGVRCISDVFRFEIE